MELAAEACHVPVETIVDLLQAGKLPGAWIPRRNLPNRWLIPVEDLKKAGLSVDNEWLEGYEASFGP